MKAPDGDRCRNRMIRQERAEVEERVKEPAQKSFSSIGGEDFRL